MYLIAFGERAENSPGSMFFLFSPFFLLVLDRLSSQQVSLSPN